MERITNSSNQAAIEFARLMRAGARTFDGPIRVASVAALAASGTTAVEFVLNNLSLTTQEAGASNCVIYVKARASYVGGRPAAGQNFTFNSMGQTARLSTGPDGMGSRLINGKVLDYNQLEGNSNRILNGKPAAEVSATHDNLSKPIGSEVLACGDTKGINASNLPIESAPGPSGSGTAAAGQQGERGGSNNDASRNLVLGLIIGAVIGAAGMTGRGRYVIYNGVRYPDRAFRNWRSRRAGGPGVPVWP